MYCPRVLALYAARSGYIPADCRRSVSSCASRSTVGRPGYLACGRVSATGAASCRVTTVADGCAAVSDDASCCEFSTDPVPHFTTFSGEPPTTSTTQTVPTTTTTTTLRPPDWYVGAYHSSQCFDMVVENIGGAAPPTELQILCGGAMCERSLTDCMSNSECPSGERCAGTCAGRPCTDPRACLHFVPCLRDSDCGAGYCVGAARVAVPALPEATRGPTWWPIDASYLMNRTCQDSYPGSDLSFSYRYTVNPDNALPESNYDNNTATGSCFVIG
jgi:hypothetical protein